MKKLKYRVTFSYSGDDIRLSSKHPSYVVKEVLSQSGAEAVAKQFLESDGYNKSEWYIGSIDKL